MKVLRLIDNIDDSGFMQMAVDEAIIESVSKGGMPVLRFYSWNPSCITIGYFQSAEKEIDLSFASKNSIDVVRRITGGGAVFHDDEITYSIIVHKDFLKNSDDLIESYREICNGIVIGLSKLGINAIFSPINDIVVNIGEKVRKISGNAQTRSGDVILQHGTVLLSVDVDKMFSLLKVPDEKMRGKMIDAVKERVTGLSFVLGRKVLFNEVRTVLAEGFCDALKCKFVEKGLSDSERARAKELCINKYSKNDWNFRR